jgi:putative acetyltransferase
MEDNFSAPCASLSAETVIYIRPAQPQDAPGIRRLLQAAFQADEEADLVEALRQAKHAALELVVEDAGQIIGQVLFSPISVQGAPIDKAGAVALAPMAIQPGFQRRGIGTTLLRDALHNLTQQGKSYVVVLGDPEYYARFGFYPAGEHGLSCEFRAPPGAFQILALQPSFRFPSGVVRFSPAFDRFKA